MAEEATEISEDKSKYNPATYVGVIDIQKIQNQFLAVLKREAKRLLEESYTGKLSADSAKTLINYLKLLRDFGNSPAPEAPNSDDENPGDDEVFSDLSVDELKNLAKQNK